MRKIFISLICLLLLLVFIGSASAFAGDTYVVHKPDKQPCVTASPDQPDHYILDGSYECTKWIYPQWVPYQCGAIQYAHDATEGTTDATVTVCPGDYYDNLHLLLKGNNGFTLQGPPTRDRSDPMNPEKNAIIHAKDTNKHVIYQHGGRDKTFTGLTLTGATGTAPCQTTQFAEDPFQPCAGIRIYGVADGYDPGCMLSDNTITGNNIGIIIKDTATTWEFNCYVEDNDIYENDEAGVHLRYGKFSRIRNNYIYDNPIGIWLADTWNNDITGNTIVDNYDYGIKLEDKYYTISNNTIWYNNIINNGTEAWDEHANLNSWNYNYWSDYWGADNGWDGRTANDGIGDMDIPHYYDDFPLTYSFNPQESFVNCYGSRTKFPVRVDNFNTYWKRLQVVYNFSSDSSIILARDIIFPEDLDLNQNKSMILRAGYNCGYTANPGTTILKGNMTVNYGALTIDSGVLGIE